MSDHKIQRESLWLLVAIVILAAIIEVASGFIIYKNFGNWNSSSAFGQTFGALNALFSGWALAGVVYTLWLQKKALEEQRLQFLKADEDLAITHAERAKTHEMLYKQVEALNRAVEMQATQLYIQYLDKQIKISSDKQSLTAEKEHHFAKLKALLERENTNQDSLNHSSE